MSENKTEDVNRINAIIAQITGQIEQMRKSILLAQDDLKWYRNLKKMREGMPK